jgi:phosphoglycolate phosphatase
LLFIFDLDGTLIDSAADLAISMNATRGHFGLAPLEPSLIYSFVGNGASVLVRRTMGPEASEALVQEALEFFIKYYRAHALEHTNLYPGIRAMIEELFSLGHALSILTNKPVRISCDIVAALGLEKYFFRVYGGNSFAAKKPDPIGVYELIREAGVKASETLLIGDSGVDVQTARNAEIACCGVKWGFQPEAFALYPPDLLIGDPRELIEQAEHVRKSDR